MKIQCARCKEIISARSKAALSQKFEAHTCKSMRDMKDMPDDLLYKVVTKALTEEQAWAEFDARQ
jgi:hypothetical protein